jgi:beta-xylosidase
MAIDDGCAILGTLATRGLFMQHRVVASLFAAVVGVAGLMAVSPAAAYAAANPAPSSFSAPVYTGDFPDPSVVLVNGTFWAYATGSGGRNLQVMSSTDLHSWSAPVDPLPVLPSWASYGLTTWAPGVLQRGATFVMYYTVHNPSLGHQCISVATAAQPRGPFSDTSTGPLICQSVNGGSIDPNPYLDPANGKLYLVWKSDDPNLGPGHPPHLWGQQLTANGLSLAAGTSPSLLMVQAARWQSGNAEGPTLVSRNGRYYLFYGANNYDTASSGIGYATSSSVLGSFTNQSTSAPWLGTRGSAQGPQGPWIFTDGSGATRMAFAAWYGKAGYENGGARSMWIGTLTFNIFGTPSVT